MDSFVKRRAKERRVDFAHHRSPTQKHHTSAVGACPESAQCIADSPQDLVTTFLPSTWHPAPVAASTSAQSSTRSGGFYNPALAPRVALSPVRSPCQRASETSNTTTAAQAPCGFFNPALAATVTSSWPWSPQPVKTEKDAAGACHIPTAIKAEPTTIVAHSAEREAETVSVAAVLARTAPGAYAPASARAVNSKDHTLLPPLLRQTTLYQPSHADTSALGDDAFSVMVLDFETTGFSAQHEHIVEVGVVELLWTGRGRGAHAEAPEVETEKALESDEEDPVPVPTAGMWRFGTRSFHRYVDPGKTDAAWWRRRVRRDARAAADAVDGTAHITTSTAVHGLDSAFLHEHGVSWREAAADLVGFCEQLSKSAPTSLSSSASSCVSESDVEEVPDTTGHEPLHEAKRHTSTTTARIARDDHVCVRLPPFMAHRAAFDTAFLETHLARVGYRVQWHAEAPVTCTAKLCKALYPQQPANLDAACQFFGIEEQLERARHGALLDATLCAQLFLRLERRARAQLTATTVVNQTAALPQD